MAKKKCPKCGNLLPEEARFCGRCRRDVKDVTPIGARPATDPVQPRSNGYGMSSNTPKIVAAVVAILVVLLLAANLHVCAICGKPFIGEAYYYASGSSTDLLDPGCANTYYGPYKSRWKA